MVRFACSMVRLVLVALALVVASLVASNCTAAVPGAGVVPAPAPVEEAPAAEEPAPDTAAEEGPEVIEIPMFPVARYGRLKGARKRARPGKEPREHVPSEASAWRIAQQWPVPVRVGAVEGLTGLVVAEGAGLPVPPEAWQNDPPAVIPTEFPESPSYSGPE